MCTKFQILAALAPNQRMTICEHHSIHLFWKQLHYSFNMRWLHDMIQRQSIPYDTLGAYRIVWIDTLAIKMRVKEYHQFTQLVFASEKRLQAFLPNTAKYNTATQPSSTKETTTLH